MVAEDHLNEAYKGLLMFSLGKLVHSKINGLNVFFLPIVLHLKG